MDVYVDGVQSTNVNLEANPQTEVTIIGDPQTSVDVAEEEKIGIEVEQEESVDVKIDGQIYEVGGSGEPGFSPTVDVEEIENGHRVTVTDIEGTETFDVMNGKDGADATESIYIGDDPPDTAKIWIKPDEKTSAVVALQGIKRDIEEAISSLEGAKEEQTKSIDVTANGSYDIHPDSGKVLSKASVNVSVPERYDEGYSVGKQEGYNEGFSEGKEEGYSEGYQASQDGIKLQEKTATKNGEVVTDDGFTGMSKVIVAVPIPEGYIQPSGTLEVTENGTFDVTDKASVNVNVESGGGDDMAGKLADRTITEFSSNSCTAIGEYAFRGCESLTTLVAPNAKSVGTYALYGCSKLKSIVLPSVTTVAVNSFREASNLEVIDLPKLTSISATTFYGCRGLKTLILRSETIVTLANTNAFTQCYRILGTKNSGYNPNGEKIGFFYVPKALIEQYKVAENWSSESLVTQFRAIEDYPEITGGVV